LEFIVSLILSKYDYYKYINEQTKTLTMKKLSVQQEILLVTNNTFSHKQWCENNTAESNNQLSPGELLEEACWNGILNELLPEIMEKPGNNKKLFLWHIRRGETFLQLELSEFPLHVVKEFSIDCNFFLSTRSCN
jgi:hypothetical protein